MKSIITLRPAHPDDQPILEQWDDQPHVIASDPNDDWNWAEELERDVPWREQLMAEKDGQPLGFIQIIDASNEETHYWGEVPAGTMAIDIWIGDAENIGKGYGTQMMGLAITRCFNRPEVHSILIDPLVTNEKAIRFYKRLGFAEVERRWFDSDECLVLIMTKNQMRKKDGSHGG